MPLPVLSSAIRINEIGRVSFEETLKIGNKHILLVPGNNCSKGFVNFQFWVAYY